MKTIDEMISRLEEIQSEIKKSACGGANFALLVTGTSHWNYRDTYAGTYGDTQAYIYAGTYAFTYAFTYVFTYGDTYAIQHRDSQRFYGPPRIPAAGRHL